MTACLITCEKTTRWAVAFRAAWDGRRPPLVETRSLAGCEAALTAAPASLVAVELTASNLRAALLLIEDTGRRFPLARAIALLAPEALDADELAREAGAIDVLATTYDVPRAARLARRHFGQVPPERLSLDQWLEQHLPWRAYAAKSSGQ